MLSTYHSMLTGWLLIIHLSTSAQVVQVIDQQALRKSTENLGANLLKQQQYQPIRNGTEDIRSSYEAIQNLQQQIQEALKSVASVQGLRWADLSKSIYLATELIRGSVHPELEIDLVVDHPLLNQNYEDIYRELFLASSADPLPADLAALQAAQQHREALISSFHQVAAERKAYAAVAFQYLADDLLLKATELNEVVKQPEQFSMTEAERIRLQTHSEEYLLLAAQMLECSDRLLLDVSSVKPMQRQAHRSRKQLERIAIAKTPVLTF